MASFLADIEKSLVPTVKVTIETLVGLYGVYVEAFRTVINQNDLYKYVDNRYITYEEIPYYKGNLLISGLAIVRPSVDYYWDMDEIFLWLPRESVFKVEPNYKIVVLSKDFTIPLRVTDRPVLTGYNNILCYKYQLVPFTENRFNDSEGVEPKGVTLEEFREKNKK